LTTATNAKRWQTHRRNAPFGELGFPGDDYGPHWEFVRLATHEPVQKLLNLSDRQIEDLQPVKKSLFAKDGEWSQGRKRPSLLQLESDITNRVLTPEQTTRVYQIMVQRAGLPVLLRNDMQKGLDLKPEQIAKITAEWNDHIARVKSGLEGNAGRESLFDAWQHALLAMTDEQRIVHVLIRSRTGFAPDGPVALGTIKLELNDGKTLAMPVAEGAPGWTLVPEGNLGRTETVAGQPCRVLRDTGSIYHKAEWIVSLPQHATVVGVRVRYQYDGADPIDVRVFTPDRKLIAAGALKATRQWADATFDRNASASRELEVLKQTDYGTGVVRITTVEFIGRDGDEVVEVRHGDPFTVRIGLHIEPELTNRDVTFFLGFARHESPYSAYVYEPRLSLPAAAQCVIDVRIDSLLLGSGQWYVNMGVGELGLYERAVINYFTIDAAWYHMLAARLELRVTSATKVDTYGCFFIHPGSVTVSEAVPALAAQQTHPV